MRGRPRRARLLRPRGDRAALGERLRRGPVRPEAEVRLDRLEREEVGDERVALEEARGLGGVGEPLEPAAEAVALLRRGGELARPRALRDELLPGRLGVEGASRHRREVALVDERPREAAQRRPLAPARRPRAGCRGRGRRGARRRRPRAARRATPPTPPRRGRPPAPRRPCGSRAGRRTRAAAPGGSGRTGRGWSRRSRARARRGRRATRSRSPGRRRARRRAPARAARAGAASWWWPRSR